MLLIIEPAALGPADSSSAAEIAAGSSSAKTAAGPHEQTHTPAGPREQTHTPAGSPDETKTPAGPRDETKAPDGSRDRSMVQGDSGGWPMRRGTLTALKKLSERGIQPAMKTGSRPEPVILALLEQEEITLADPDEKTWKEQPLEQRNVTVSPDGSLILSKREERTAHAPGKPAGRKHTHDPDDNSPDTGSPDTTSTQTNAGPSFSDWPALTAWLLEASRTATRIRKTAETDISVRINLDGTGKSRIDTGIPFYDHMLEQIARHGYMDIDIACRGDLEIDEHHTIEDTAITLGEAIGEALGDKRGIGRYGFAVAMDETRSLVAIDLSGRPWCVFEGTFRREKVGDFPTEMTSHFFHSLAMALKATLHVSVKGDNDHHQIEACFKGLARCLRQAVDRNEHYLDILPSSKGML